MKKNLLLQLISCCWKERKSILPIAFTVLLFTFTVQVQKASATGNNSCNSCSNVTNGGSICGDEARCCSYDPSCIVNVSLPCGGSGTLEYRWESSTDNSTWTCIAGACNSSYDPCSITQTTWYRRLSRRSNCTNYVGESNVVVKQVNTPPVVCITANGSTTICQGGSVELCASSGNCYLWSNGATTQCITVTCAGTYSVTVTNSSGCSGCASKCVTVRSIPSCSISGDGSICQGQSTTLSAPFYCATYLWNTGATTRCISVNTSGTYTVTVTNGNGCSSSCSKCVNVSPIPSCTITGCGTICYGGSTTLSAPDQCAGYLWNTGATTRCITVTCAGTYSVTVRNSSGCCSTCSKCVTVSQPPSCTITGCNSICYGGSTTLSAPDQCASYLWNTGATTRCITVTCAGTYAVTVTNNSGCSSTCDRCVTVNQLPLCCITGDNVICHGQSTTLTATDQCASYLWSTGATTRCITVSCGGTYSVTVTNNSGCSSTCSICVTERQAPTCCISGNTNIHHGQCTLLSAPWGCNSYLWSNGATTRSIYVNCAGTYCVTVTNSYGCSSTCSVCVTWSSCRTSAHSGDQQLDENTPMESFGNVDAQVFPNPFTSNATFAFENKGDKAKAIVEVYDVHGAKVTELYNGDAESNQQYKVEWNADGIPAGVYMYRIVCGEEVVTGRIIHKN